MSTAVLCSLAWDGPKRFLEIYFLPPHAANFLAALTSKQQETNNGIMVSGFTGGVPNSLEFIFRKNTLPCPFNTFRGVADGISIANPSCIAQVKSRDKDDRARFRATGPLRRSNLPKCSATI